MATALPSPDPSFRVGRPARSFRAVAALVAGLALIGGGVTGAMDSEEDSLVPAALGVRTDGQGNTWNIESNGSIGRVGSTMVNSGSVLEINGEKFVGFQPMMTPDGTEFVLQGRAIDSLPGLRVQRRIRIADSIGALRYAEMLYNGSVDPMTISVALTTNFSGNYKTFLTDRGRTEPVLLDEDESGIVVLPGATQSTRAFLFMLASVDSDLKPTISARNRYALTFQFRIDLAPGETRILLHEVAQIVIPQRFERRDLLETFRPFSLIDAIEPLPESWQPYLANVKTDAGGRRRASPVFPLPEIGVEPGSLDLLLLGEQTRLPGRASGGAVRFGTLYGESQIELDQLQAIVSTGGSEGSRTSRLHFRDGQVIEGEAAVADFQFRPTGGEAIDLAPGAFDRVVFSREATEEPSEGRFAGMVEVHRGDRIGIANGPDSELEFATAWGVLRASLADVVWFGPAAGGVATGWLELDDGIRCYATLATNEVSLPTVSFGTISLPAIDLRSIYVPDGERGSVRSQSEWGSEPEIARVRLTGGQVLVGRLVPAAVTVSSGGVAIDSEVGQIRSISVEEQGTAGQFADSTRGQAIEIVRWDGGVVRGAPGEETLLLDVGGESWRIPFRDIDLVETPSPELTEEARKEVGDKIALLGADDWGQREQASRELAAFGYLARPLLLKQLRVAKDPEVRRRLERILADLN